MGVAVGVVLPATDPVFDFALNKKHAQQNHFIKHNKSNWSKLELNYGSLSSGGFGSEEFTVVPSLGSKPSTLCERLCGDRKTSTVEVF